MSIEFRLGERPFFGFPLEQFDEYPAFSETWAEKVVPERVQLNAWDHKSAAWQRPVGRRRLRIAPGIQCFCLDGMGQRDGHAEAAAMRRILDGLGVSFPRLKTAIAATLPPTEFVYDTEDAVPAEARKAASWQVFGQARFFHLVLRFPAGRVGDWMLLSVPTDFVLSRRRLGQPASRPASGTATRTGTLAERVFDMMGDAGRGRSASSAR